MAIELEDQLSEESELIKSSGGVFEIEDNGFLIFSKKELHRFPADGEILEVLKYKAEGMSLEQAQAKAGEKVPAQPSFLEWFNKFLSKSKTVNR